MFILNTSISIFLQSSRRLINAVIKADIIKQKPLEFNIDDIRLVEM